MYMDIPSPPPDFSLPLPLGTSYYTPPSPRPSEPMSEMEFFLWECLNEPETIDSATVKNGPARSCIPVEVGSVEQEPHDSVDQAGSNWSLLTETKSQGSVRDGDSSGLFFRMTPEPLSARNNSQEPSRDPAFRESILYGVGSWCHEVISLDKDRQHSSQNVDVALQALENDLKACSVGSVQSTNRSSSKKDPQDNHKGKARRLSKKGQKTRPKK